METWKGFGDRRRYREGHTSPIVWRDPDSFEVDRLELGRDAAENWALETRYPAETVRQRLGIEEPEA